MVSQVTSIKFGIIGDDDIVNMSVCEIDNPSLAVDMGTVYDPRLGCVQNNSVCATCSEGIWGCPGHFGHINLNVPIILFYKQCVPILKSFCFNCHRMLCTAEELQLNGIHGYDRIVEYLSNVSSCTRCQTPHPEIRFNISDSILLAQHKYKTNKAVRELTPTIIKAVFDDIPDEDVKLLGIDVTMFHPRNLVLTKFLVLPTCCRPRMITPTNASDDDLTLMLIDIIKNNNSLGKVVANTTADSKQAAYDKAVAAIKFKTLAYCDNSKGKATHTTNHKPMTGIKERITKKSGIVRQNLMGKRCDKTARTVVGPDPTLKLDQVAVPDIIANSLTIPEYVTPLTIQHLSKLVNNRRASTVIKTNGTKINVTHASTKRGTQLSHGDVIERNGTSIVVTDCKFALKRDDKIFRNGKLVPTVLPTTRRIELEIGDKVERYLQDGDPVLINRQPTLHRNSMQGMKIVVKPGKTLRVNLSIVSGFNMDFDGDEGNLFDQETLEAKAELLYISNAKQNILSGQSNKPEMVIVQDSLLGAYKMTFTITRMTWNDFSNCLYRTGALERYPDIHARLRFVQSIRNETELTSAALFGFMFPPDFHVSYPTLEIKFGVVVSGFFDKTILKGTPNSVIRLLCLEYGIETTATFIDDIQFLTNAWLEIYPFSIGISDCVIGNSERADEIKHVVHKYFIEADQVAKMTDNIQIRESRVNCSLNKAKDIGLRIAKDAFRPDNNFISTVGSGSKGDYFNIAQITGLLGQQNLNGSRPIPSLNNKRRTMIHYPHLITDPQRKYESRGFVGSSFLRGMNPKEMFFHAMTGREGIINTAMGTATSGYIQRSCIKLNEDLKVAYDGTIRDANQNIYQFAYGNHGFDPCKVTFKSNGDVHPVDFQRLAARFNGNEPGNSLSLEKIDAIVEGCKWKCQISKPIFDKMWQKHETVLRTELASLKLRKDKYDEFYRFVVDKYHLSRATPGDSVGIIAAQSIGEKQTQTNLNTFHTAGKLQDSGARRFEEILNMSKTFKVRTATIYFLKKYATAEELRRDVGCSIVGVKFGDVVGKPKVSFSDDVAKFKYRFDKKRLFENRISPDVISDKLNSLSYSSTFTSEHIIVEIKFERERTPTVAAYDSSENDEPSVVETCQKSSTIDPLKFELESILVCGIDGIRAMYLDYDGTEWYAVTEGCNFRRLLAHPLIDLKRLYCNDIAEVFACLGIAAVRKVLFNDIKKVVNGVNDLHIQLLVDKMTVKGKPMSINRYTMRTNDVGPLSKATFEESTDILINAAVKTEIETNCGVSAAIISGNQPRVGTGIMGLKVDFEKLMTPKCDDPPVPFY